MSYVGQAPPGVAELAPAMTDLRQADELLHVCSAIGIRLESGPESSHVYTKGIECRDVLNDLLRGIRREGRHGTQSFIRQLGVFNILERDLLPLLIEYAGDQRESRLMTMLLRLITYLTLPADSLFSEAEDNIERTTPYIQVCDFLQEYKKAFITSWTLKRPAREVEKYDLDPVYVGPAALEALKKLLIEPLSREARDKADEDVLSLVLTILRNILHVPDRHDHRSNRQSLHDRAILAFQESGITDLMVNMANHIEMYESCNILVMEILVQLVREQDPARILGALTERQRDEMVVVREQRLLEHEETQVRNESIMRKLRSTRHPRFGGAFEIKAKDKPAPKFFPGALPHLRDPSKTSGDANKAEKKKKVQVDPEMETLHISPPEVLNILFHFSVDFLCDGYNLLLPSLKGTMEKQADETMPYDEVHYAQLMRYFLEFHRVAAEKGVKLTSKLRHKEEEEAGCFDVELIASTLNRENIVFLQQTIMKFGLRLQEDKPGAALWSRRLHHAIRAFHELLLTLDCLHRSKVEEQQEFAATMLAIVFYDFDFMEWLPRLCRTFTLKKQSRAFLKDLILAVHFTLKMISTLKSSEAYKIFTARRRRGGKKASKRAADGTAPTAAEQPEGEVDLSQLFEASEEQGESNKDLADRGREYEFDLKSYLLRFAEAKVVLTYTEALRTYTTNSPEVNHAVVKMLYKIYDPNYCDHAPLLYQLSIFTLFESILADPIVTSQRKEFAELTGFILRSVIPGFFQSVKDYQLLFLETLFVKSEFDVTQILEGPTKAQQMRDIKKTKKWDIESSKKLLELYELHKDEDNVLDIIENTFAQAGDERTRLSIKAKLSNLGFDVGPTQKWTTEQLKLLRSAYEECKDAKDPLQVIAAQELFPEENNTAGKLRNQLKKMGIILNLHRSTPWSDEDLDVLRELHDEFKSYPTDVMIDFMKGDVRLDSKTKKSIKEKLFELQLIKLGRGDRTENNKKLGGDLEPEFILRLQGLKSNLNGSLLDQLQLSWLINRLDERASLLESTAVAAPETDSVEDESIAAQPVLPFDLVPDDMDEAIILLPLLQALNFVTALEDVVDEAERTSVAWQIPAEVPAARLRDIIEVLAAPLVAASKRKRSKASNTKKTAATLAPKEKNASEVESSEEESGAESDTAAEDEAAAVDSSRSVPSTPLAAGQDGDLPGSSSRKRKAAASSAEAEAAQDPEARKRALAALARRRQNKEQEKQQRSHTTVIETRTIIEAGSELVKSTQPSKLAPAAVEADEDAVLDREAAANDSAPARKRRRRLVLNQLSSSEENESDNELEGNFAEETVGGLKAARRSILDSDNESSDSSRGHSPTAKRRRLTAAISDSEADESQNEKDEEERGEEYGQSVAQPARGRHFAQRAAIASDSEDAEDGVYEGSETPVCAKAMFAVLGLNQDAEAPTGDDFGAEEDYMDMRPDVELDSETMSLLKQQPTAVHNSPSKDEPGLLSVPLAVTPASQAHITEETPSLKLAPTHVAHNLAAIMTPERPESPTKVTCLVARRKLERFNV